MVSVTVVQDAGRPLVVAGFWREVTEDAEESKEDVVLGCGADRRRLGCFSGVSPTDVTSLTFGLQTESTKKEQ